MWKNGKLEDDSHIVIWHTTRFAKTAKKHKKGLMPIVFEQFAMFNFGV
jgi:hypothetical protein